MWKTKFQFQVKTLRLIALLSFLWAGTESPIASAETEPPAPIRPINVLGAIFGEPVEIRMHGTAIGDAEWVARTGRDAIAKMERIESELNEGLAGFDSAVIGEPSIGRTLTPLTFEAVYQAKRVAEVTGGAYDPTVEGFYAKWQQEIGAAAADGGQEDLRDSFPDSGVPETDVKATRPWPFVPRAAVERIDGTLTDAKRHALLNETGYNQILLIPEQRALRFGGAEVRLNLSQIAKGLSLNAAAAHLEKNGIKNFVINRNGDLLLRGNKNGEIWRIGIQDPGGEGHFASFPFSDGAVMTIGGYSSHLGLPAGQEYGTIDPRTGKWVSPCRSVTIVSQKAETADAFAWAIFVLGAQDGIALVNRLHGIEAVLVDKNNRVFVSDGLQSTLRYRAPTP
jgi:thiamine biosynthesis lipoprotein ApbE